MEPEVPSCDIGVSISLATDLLAVMRSIPTDYLRVSPCIHSRTQSHQIMQSVGEGGLWKGCMTEASLGVALGTHTAYLIVTCAGFTIHLPGQAPRGQGVQGNTACRR